MARLNHDPLAELNDQTGLLGQRDEVGRRDDALGRMSPTHQRLDGLNTPCLVLYDRLIDEIKLIAPDSLTKIVLQSIAAVSLRLELLVVETVAVATLILCLIECEIGVFQDLVATVAMLGRERNANAASNSNSLSFNLIRRV